MMVPRVLALILICGAAGGCGPSTHTTPRLLDQSARQDLEGARVVVLGKVASVSDTAPRRGAAGYRPIEVSLSVMRVLKGSLSSGHLCVVYFYPYGGYDGPGSAWIEVGATGIFALVPDERCFRVVNDRRAIIRSHGEPRNPPMPLARFVAEATLPTRGGCRTGSNQVASEILSITVPLIGSRASWELLEGELGGSDVGASACTCLAVSQVWRVDQPCLDNLPEASMDRSQVDAVRTTNQALLQRERGWFAAGPPSWLMTMVDGYGLDGAILRLHELLDRDRFQVTKAACTALAGSLQSGDVNDSLAAARARWNEAAEDNARLDFDKWLLLGCPTSHDGLKTLMPEGR